MEGGESRASIRVDEIVEYVGDKCLVTRTCLLGPTIVNGPNDVIEQDGPPVGLAHVRTLHFQTTIHKSFNLTQAFPHSSVSITVLGALICSLFFLQSFLLLL